jgi:hypothetical protein
LLFSSPVGYICTVVMYASNNSEECGSLLTWV